MDKYSSAQSKSEINAFLKYEKPVAVFSDTTVSAEEAYSAAAAAAAAPAVQPVVTAGAAVGAAAFTKFCW